MSYNRKVVLAIDDTTVNLMSIRDSLEPFNKYIDLRLAKNSGIALKTLKAVKVDLILLDIEMPDISGFELLDIFKDINYIKNIPVIFVTSTGDTDTVIRATMSGAIDYVIKPVKATVLRNKVAAALNLGIRDE